VSAAGAGDFSGQLYTARRAMEASNRTLWVILCVVIVIALVLAALLLSHGRPSETFFRGGLAAAAGGQRRELGKVGGAPGDIWNSTQSVMSSSLWRFSHRQMTATPHLMDLWNNVRAEYHNLVKGVDTAYYADPALTAIKLATWGTAYKHLNMVKDGLESMVDAYEVEPPTTDAGTKFQDKWSAIMKRNGHLDTLHQELEKANDGLERDAALENVDVVKMLIGALKPPVMLEQPAGVSTEITQLVANAVTAHHTQPVADALIRLRNTYRTLRGDYTTHLNSLPLGTDPDPVIDRSKRVSAFEAPLLAAIDTYTTAASAATADRAAANKRALTDALAAIGDPAWQWLAPLQDAIDALLPIVPPPLAHVNAAITGFNPAIATLVHAHPPSTVDAVRATVAAADALGAVYRQGDNRKNKGARGELAATDRDLLALEDAVAAVIADYTAPLTAMSPAQSATNLAQLQQAYNAFSRWYAPALVIQNVEAAFKRIAPIPVESIPNPDGVFAAKPLTASQRLIRLATVPDEEVNFSKTVSASARGAVVLEAASEAELDVKLARTPDVAARLYGLVVDKPGDIIALYKAVAINIGARTADEVEAKKADVAKAATGRLYTTFHLPTGGYYKQFRDYIKPTLYAVA